MEIRGDGRLVAEAMTDAFGEFKVDRLPPDGGTYVVRVLRDGFTPLEVATEVRGSVYLGTLLFAAEPVPS